MKKNELSYLSCPYSHPEEQIRKRRLFFANFTAFQIIKRGGFVYSPLTHNIPINRMGLMGKWDEWKEFDFLMLSRCDKIMVLKLDGWDASQGVQAEIAHAKKIGLPIEEVGAPDETTFEHTCEMDTLQALLQRMFEFYRERDWDQYHSPKNIAMDLASEVGELIEHFRWLTEAQSYHLSGQSLDEVRDEIGDCFKALVYLAAKLGIDPVEAGHQKLVKMGQRYPAHLSKGNCKKYTAHTLCDAD